MHFRSGFSGRCAGEKTRSTDRSVPSDGSIIYVELTLMRRGLEDYCWYLRLSWTMYENTSCRSGSDDEEVACQTRRERCALQRKPYSHV